jgi:hypothetical protein
MIDDDGVELQPGDRMEYRALVESSVEPEIGEENVLGEGEYHIYVPPGQRAIVRYEAAVNNEGEDDVPHDDSDPGVTFDANDPDTG